MALLDAGHRSARAPSQRFTERKIHPSICLATGFGFIMASALAVHVIFNALM